MGTMGASFCSSVTQRWVSDTTLLPDRLQPGCYHGPSLQALPITPGPGLLRSWCLGLVLVLGSAALGIRPS